MMNSINAVAVGMRAVGVARALQFADWTQHAATPAHASASAAPRKRRTAAATFASVDGDAT